MDDLARSFQCLSCISEGEEGDAYYYSGDERDFYDFVRFEEDQADEGDTDDEGDEEIDPTFALLERLNNTELSELQNLLSATSLRRNPEISYLLREYPEDVLYEALYSPYRTQIILESMRTLNVDIDGPRMNAIYVSLQEYLANHEQREALSISYQMVESYIRNRPVSLWPDNVNLIERTRKTRSVPVKRGSEEIESRSAKKQRSQENVEEQPKTKRKRSESFEEHASTPLRTISPSKLNERRFHQAQAI